MSPLGVSKHIFPQNTLFEQNLLGRTEFVLDKTAAEENVLGTILF